MSVNYLLEINALDDWELTHPLSATAYKVMRKLLYLANKERFPERMNVPNRVLLSIVGCSEDSLIKARNQLIQHGLIEYKGQKKVTPLYIIRYFSNNPIYNPKIQSIEQGNKHGIMQGIEQGFDRGIKQGTIINLLNPEEEKGHNNAAAMPDRPNSLQEDAVEKMKNLGIPLGPDQLMCILEFYKNGISDAVLKMAVEEAVENGKTTFAYIRAVVNTWIGKGITTEEKVQEHRRRFREEKERWRAGMHKTVSAQEYTQRRYTAEEYQAMEQENVAEMIAEYRERNRLAQLEKQEA